MPLISSTSALDDLVALAREAGHVAVDTEFVWERTYYPRLGLIQIGIGSEQTFLIDAPAVELAALGPLLEDDGVTKILHDAGQDLAILSRESGAAPRNIFDTQVAAGFVGLSATISLQALLAEILGIRLSKGATRSDWMRRPLSEEQLQYAREDVLHLSSAYEALVTMLEERGRLSWALEEMKQYDASERYTEGDPRERYRQTKGRGKRGFGGRDYSVLRELAAWRESEARRRDRPRGHIVSDDALIEVARRKPTEQGKLEHVRALSPAARQRYGADLVAAVERGLAVPQRDWPAPRSHQPEDPSATPRLDLVQALLRGRGEREGVDPQLVANRADVEALIHSLPPNREGHAMLEGWRREFIGADLEALLAGEAAVALDDEGLPQIVRLQ